MELESDVEVDDVVWFCDDVIACSGQSSSDDGISGERVSESDDWSVFCELETWDVGWDVTCDELGDPKK